MDLDPSPAPRGPSTPPISTINAGKAEAIVPVSTPAAKSEFVTLKERLDQLVPGNSFSALDLQECKLLQPQVWRLIELSLKREEVVFSQQEFEDECQRVHNLRDDQIGVLMRATARFVVGEEVVESELAPLMRFYNRRHDKYREIFVAIQQAEEKIHADFFKRYTQIVFGPTGAPESDRRMEELSAQFLNAQDDYSRPFRRFFQERLPKILSKLDKVEKTTFATSREIAALTCYHIFAEGVVAESAYFGFREALRNSSGDLLPTVLKGIDMIKQHESTHIAFGVTRLQEIMQANWLSRTAFKFVFLVNCMASFPTVAGIVLAVHREHPGNFPFPLDQLKLAREGLKQLASRLRAVLFQGAKSPRSVREL